MTSGLQDRFRRTRALAEVPGGLLDLIAPVVCSLAAAWVLAAVLLRCRAGLDLSDESFYLIWITDPWRYPGSASQFGFVYHPLLKLVGGNIALLRQAGVVITTALAFTIFRLLLSGCAQPQLEKNAIASALATTALLSVASWLITPNYNSLCLQGTMLALIGVLAAYPLSGTSRQTLGIILIAVGGVLVFLAKPTSAVLIGAVIAGFIAINDEKPFAMICWTTMTACIVLTLCILPIDGSIPAFIERLRGGTTSLYALVPEFHVLRADLLDAPTKAYGRFGLAVAAGAVWALAARQDMKAVRYARFVVIDAVCAAAATAVTLTQLSSQRSDANWVFDAYTIPALWIGAGLALLLYARHHNRMVPTPRAFAFAVVFFLAPFCFAFGSSNNIWRQAMAAAGLWTAAGLSVFAAVPSLARLRHLILGLAVGSMGIAAMIVAGGMEYPYHQSMPLRLNSEAVRIGSEDGSTLYLNPQLANYVASLRSAMQHDGKGPQAVLDMTGRLPGNAYLVDSIGPGTPWLQSGWAGGAVYLHGVLDRVPCHDLSAAWVISAPDAPVAFPAGALERYGIDLNRDYAEVARIKFPALKYNNIRSDLLILKPLRTQDDAVAACEKTRSGDARPHSPY